MTAAADAGADRFARYPSLAGRVAFVSGGATGLGAEFVTQLAAQGVEVAFTDIDTEHGEALVREVAAAGLPEPWFAPCDVRDVPALQRVIGEAAAARGPITVLVNNAANDTRHPYTELDAEAFDDRIAVNLRHHLFAIQAVAPMMREQGGGSIINLGSISAHADFIGMVGYITAKAGIEGLTRTMARELGPDKIRVNCLIPGWVLTERQLREHITEADLETIRQKQCLAEPVVPADLARMLLWLASDDSAACTGQQWVVDGGWL
ncbi:SDR family NAD(P)-dependent oxidoreductase [Desertihabitans aurantiacus]|uniref:SDR family NAD(P)-dependent oxidoreductase n=1 Tax=Desertihabitans aurantiacus TaxID=2282477 RepID=UPI000DF811FD|nr:SDR family oxidoreductase [Desertihabitans aurantiacus]